jgi:ABC-2 type transport system permease protein
MLYLFRSYAALVRVGWLVALEYRAQALLWLLSALFPLVMMSAWLAVVSAGGAIDGWTRSDFLSYYVAAMLVEHLTSTWLIYECDEDVRTGSLSPKLLKPISPVHPLLAEQVAWKIFSVVVVLPVFVLAAVLVPAIHYEVTVLRLLAFAVATIIGFAIRVLIDATFCCVAFWSTQSKNLHSLFIGIGHFLSGLVVPLAILPTVLQKTAVVLPFHNVLGFPVEIITRRPAPEPLYVSFVVGVAWVLGLLAFYRLLWRFGLRRYEAVGA